ncbi:MAG TPA: type II toxin-antitoxin system Phd/YefM family antitoxin [Longimicrobiales bacterium]|nr:type II toxin-antitoxin system Phd/YefM family antitoxin [Longimicrobiales bacterium]
MKRTYSLYEAKAKLSEIVRQVRERGVPVTISYHGKPVVEVRPIEAAVQSEDPMEARIKDMIARGELLPGKGPPIFRSAQQRQGALARFLAERD